MEETRLMSSDELIKKFKAMGRQLARVNGSHHIFEKQDELLPIVVSHSRKDLAAGTPNKLLK